VTQAATGTDRTPDPHVTSTECLDLREVDLRTPRPEEPASVASFWRPGGAASPDGGEWFMADGIVVSSRPLTTGGAHH
jgi:hypothetical protein